MADDQNLTGTISLNDGVTKTLQAIIASLKDTTDAVGVMQKELGKSVDTAAVERMKTSLDSAKTSVDDVAKSLPAVKQQTDKATGAVEDATQALKGMGAVKLNALLGIIKQVGSAAGAIFGFCKQAVSGLTDMSDQAASINAKLKLITGSEEAAAAMNDRIAQAANNARGSYSEMADVVAKLGMNAKGAFKDQNELVDTVEQLQKHFKLAGASSDEAASAMYNLTQSMSSGKLLGQDLRILKQNAPSLVQAIKDSLGVTSEKLDNLVSEGEVSARQVVEALGGAADDINAKFANLPVTFSEIRTQLQNTLGTTLQPMMLELSAMLTDEGFQDTIGELFSTLATVVQAVFPLIKALLPAVQQVMGTITDLLTDPEIQNALNMIFGFLADTLMEIAPLVTALMPLVQMALEILAAIMPILAPLIELVTVLVGAIMPILNFLFQELMLILDILMPYIQLLIAYWKWVIDILGSVIEFVYSKLGGVIEKIREWVNKIIGWITPLLKLAGIDISSGSTSGRGGRGWHGGGNSSETPTFDTGDGWGSLTSIDSSSQKTAKNTSKMADSLEWAKDYAKQQAMSRLTSAQFIVNMQGMHNNISHEGGYLGLQSAVTQGVNRTGQITTDPVLNGTTAYVKIRDQGSTNILPNDIWFTFFGRVAM